MNNNYPSTISKKLNNMQDNYIVFYLKEKQYAINIKNVIEIINIPEIDIHEQTPKGIIGMFNYNGTMIKIIDLCPFLGFDTTNFTINNQIIIMAFEDNVFAVHTEKIENVAQFDCDDIQNIPYANENSILKEVCKYGNNIISIIDIEMLNKQILSSNEISGIDYTKLFPSDEKSLQILKLRANQHKIEQEAFSFPININTSNQYILFTLSKQNFYLDLKYVKEFISIKRLNITKLPYTQDFIKGIINVRGEFLVIIDLKRFLNNDANDIKEGSKLIITEGKNFNIALLVDEIKYIKTLKNIPPSAINVSNTNYLSSEFMEEDDLYGILNFEKIINDERLFINVN